jgi:hypothetical protein
MYILILLLVPLLFLFNTYLAVGGLAVVIVAMYVMRTRPAKRPTPKIEDSTYSAGYEN